VVGRTVLVMISGEQVASKSELSSKRNIEFRYRTVRNMAVGISVQLSTCMLLNENSVSGDSHTMETQLSYRSMYILWVLTSCLV
jgi:hypothetical protein